MRPIVSFLQFWYDFIIGDDWTIAVGVAAALVATYALAHSGASAWYLLPAIVVVGLAVSLWRETKPKAGPQPKR
jgi:hypothetical protein